MKRQIIIVAGGKGLRMESDLPKQFIPIGGKPVLMHTLSVFHTFDPAIDIILVLPKDHQAYWQDLCTTYNFTIPHMIANGGETRFHSVTNGLAKACESAHEETIIGVHDGVRPFVSLEVIQQCYQTASKEEAVIPVILVHETIREINETGSFTVDRNKYRLVQTPQVFRSNILTKAYAQPFSEAFTDDASVAEAAGYTVTLTEGNRENIKITSPFDLIVAEALLQKR